MNTMRALTLSNGKLLVRADYPVPVMGPGDCLVRIFLAGVCSTDLEMIAGYKSGFAGVLGHEFVGEVVAAPGAEEWIGKRVVGEINIGCGKCSLCSRGLTKHCRNRRTIGIVNKDGAFAEYLALPVDNLHCVPESLPNERAVFVEPLAAALQILEQVKISPSDKVAVIGDGRLGLLCAQVVARTGCQLTVFGHHNDHLAYLSDLDIHTVLAQGRAQDAQNVDAFDVVVEATGSHSGFVAAQELVRPGGVIVLKSTFAGSVIDFDSSRFVVDEITVIGSRCGPFAPSLRLLDKGQVLVDQMIQATYSLDDAVAALEFAGKRGVLKVLIAP